MKVTVLEPIKKNKVEWDLIEYEKEIDVSHNDDREKPLCRICTMDSYPECKKWCPQYEK